MGLPARSVYSLLVQMHDIDDEHRAAFVSQIHAIIRAGLPLANRPGRGREAIFEADDFWLLTMAAELMQCGLSPTRIIGLLGRSWAVMRADIAHITDLWHAEQPSIFTTSVPAETVWIVRLEASGRLARQGRAYATEADDQVASRTYADVIAGDLGESIATWRSLVLDATRMVSFYLSLMCSRGTMSADALLEFSAPLKREWASPRHVR